MRPPVAAEYAGVSPAYLKQLRARDRVRLARGKPIEGPPKAEHVTAGQRTLVSYPTDKLTEWADSFWTHSGSSPPKTIQNEDTPMNEHIEPRTYGLIYQPLIDQYFLVHPSRLDDLDYRVYNRADLDAFIAGNYSDPVTGKRVEGTSHMTFSGTSPTAGGAKP